MVIESMPEGLQASSAVEAIKLITPRQVPRHLGDKEGGGEAGSARAAAEGALAGGAVLSLAVYKLACSASANEPDLLFKDEI